MGRRSAGRLLWLAGGLGALVALGALVGSTVGGYPGLASVGRFGGPGAAGSGALPEGLGHVHALALDSADPRVVWLGAHHGLFRSEDGGRTFVPVLVGTDTMAVVPAFGAGGWYAAGHGFLYWSGDGRTWQPLIAGEAAEGLPWPDIHGLAAAAAPAGGPDVLFAWLAGAGPFTSPDGGRTWQALEPPASDVADAVLAAGGPAGSGEGPSVAVAAADGRVWTLAGARWVELPPVPGGVVGMAFDPSPDPALPEVASGGGGRWWAVGPAGVWRLDDGADRWAFRAAPAAAGPSAAGAVGEAAELAAVAVGPDGSVMVAARSGTLWRWAAGTAADAWTLVEPRVDAGSGAAGYAAGRAPSALGWGEASDPLGRRTLALARRLRCPYCVGLSVADSDSFVSVQIREFIRERLAEGDSEAAITAYLVERYGPGILWDPPKRGVFAWAWLVPVLALAGGALVVAGAYAARRGAGAEAPPQGPAGAEAEAIDAAVRDVM